MHGGVVSQTYLDGVHPDVGSSSLARQVGFVHADLDSRADRRDRQERLASPDGGADTLAADTRGELVERSEVTPPPPSPSAPPAQGTAGGPTANAAVRAESSASPAPTTPPSFGLFGPNTTRADDLSFEPFPLPSSPVTPVVTVSAVSATAAVELYAVALHAVGLYAVGLYAVGLHIAALDAAALHVATVAVPPDGEAAAATTRAAPAGLSAGSVRSSGFTIASPTCRGVVAGRPAAYSRYLRRPALCCGDG